MQINVPAKDKTNKSGTQGPVSGQITDAQKTERANKTSESSHKKVRCFNCSSFGHVSTECKEAKREKGSCFKYRDKNYQMKDCPQLAKKKQIAVLDWMSI